MVWRSIGLRGDAAAALVDKIIAAKPGGVIKSKTHEVRLTERGSIEIHKVGFAPTPTRTNAYHAATRKMITDGG